MSTQLAPEIGYAVAPGALTIEKRKSSGIFRGGKRGADGIGRGEMKLPEEFFMSANGFYFWSA